MSLSKATASPSHMERVSAEQTGEGLMVNATSTIPLSVASRATFSPSGEGSVYAGLWLVAPDYTVGLMSGAAR